MMDGVSGASKGLQARRTADRRVRLVLTAGILLASVLSAQGTAHSEQPFIGRHPVYGGVEATFGSCPDTVELPPVGTECDETYIILWRGYTLVGGGSVAPVGAPWNYYAESVHLKFTGDLVPEITVLRNGYGEVPGIVAVDQVHLNSATASVQLPMSDGTTLDFVGSWTATSDRFVFGNDGPAIGGRQHFVSRCVTFVALGHQKYTEAAMIGTLDGVPVHSYTAWSSADIFNNSFRLIEVAHGSRCT